MATLPGVIYPAYQSFKALESNCERRASGTLTRVPSYADDEQWLTYWCVLWGGEYDIFAFEFLLCALQQRESTRFNSPWLATIFQIGSTQEPTGGVTHNRQQHVNSAATTWPWS